VSHTNHFESHISITWGVVVHMQGCEKYKVKHYSHLRKCQVLLLLLLLLLLRHLLSAAR
jgi:hypothetical protein